MLKSNINELFNEYMKNNPEHVEVEDICNFIQDHIKYYCKITKKDFETEWINTRIRTKLNNSDFYAYKVGNFVSLDAATPEQLRNMGESFLSDIKGRAKTLERLRKRYIALNPIEGQLKFCFDDSDSYEIKETESFEKIING